MSWFYWDTYLKGGKNKGATVERPMPSGGQTKRVVRMSDGSIGLKLHHTYCVRFYQDGTVAYDTGGWNTITTRRFINDHGPVRVFSEKYDLRLSVKIGTTPPRVQKCRRCHGKGQVPNECYGPSWCHGYASYGGRPCDHGETSYHRAETCSHGQAARHRLDDIDCWQCSASGKYDYGSRTIWFPWHGSYYRFNPDDPTVEVQGGPVTYATAEETPPVHSGQSYEDSGQILAALMPDINATVKHPCNCGRLDSTVHDVIIHLNDTDRWTRERIADWLDTLDLNLRFPTPTT